MKLKSEFYVYELNLINIGLTVQMKYILSELDRQKRKLLFRRFFAPWTLDASRDEVVSNLNSLLQHAKMLSELRDKILEAEGSDDDMRPITFRQMIEKES